MSNDARIREYRDAVEIKREKLGCKPTLGYVTNALLEINGDRVNLNTLYNETKCVELVGILLASDSFTKQANKALGTNIERKFGDYSVAQWIKDIKSRLKLLAWEQDKKKLNAMNKKLEALMSDDAKTADAIASIAAQLEE